MEVLEVTHGGNTTTPGGGDNPNPPSGGNSNLTEEEKNKLEDNGIKELGKDEITNDNLKDNDNIKGVIEGEVPIPEGSDYVEGTKDTGVVVAFGDSEFVWVPVPNIDEMARLQGNETNNYQGVLYDFSGTTATEMTNYGIGTTDRREPDVLNSSQYDGYTGFLAIINNILGTNYTAASQLKVDLQKDYNEMIESVKKYKGFFIGRYETSLDENKKAKSKVGELPATADKDSANMWYGLYAYQKKMAEDNGLTSVKSHMIWGSNYDAMLRWALEGADAAKVTGSGNAAHDLSSVYETGKETIAGKVDRINNIYDLEGNGYEWTAEANATNCRSNRGGHSFRNYAASRRDNDGSPRNAHSHYLSRPILYIK